MKDLQLWGGHECTVNRVGDVYHDQTVRSGHQNRAEDLERFADLGIEALRYPLLWERIAPGDADQADWRWTDDRLSRLSALDIRPIAGLLHHGSGPRSTNLLAEDFAAKFAGFAGSVARRYQSIVDWIPINEPLTTARFSALYGHWYPHRVDERSFWLALLNQVDGIRLAMRAIRSVIPEARLIQTEDLGRTYATRAISHQARFDNHRRWMTWDLLFGRVTKHHSLWERLSKLGLQRNLQVIADDPCPPDVIGINHYLTSDRFLDQQCENYPPEKCGGNGFARFADVEAIRVLAPPPQGLAGALDEAWDRYRAPLAVTECQLGCSRENQVRWIGEAWTTAGMLRARGVRIEAVTAWALLGSYNWNSLLTQEGGYYESGAFDVRGPLPRQTAVGDMLRGLKREPPISHFAAEAGLGWWRRDVRLTYKPVFHSVVSPQPMREHTLRRPSGRPILITGASGVLGQALARQSVWRDLDYALTSRETVDLNSASNIHTALDQIEPWVVINTAGWSDVDEAELDPAKCYAANRDLPVRLAQACAARNLPFVNFSSALVFDGRREGPRTESDPLTPLSVYGKAKAQADEIILGLGEGMLVVRTSALFSPFDDKNFAAGVVQALSRSRSFAAADDVIISPTYVPSLVDATLDLVLDGERGLWHIANQGTVSYAEWGKDIARALDLDPALIRSVSQEELLLRAARPRNCALTSARGHLAPTLSDGVGRFAYSMRESGFQPVSAFQQPIEQQLSVSPAV